ncbi:MAG: hypothetical protein QM784_15000 [Polyangiaceae bacterium]
MSAQPSPDEFFSPFDDGEAPCLDELIWEKNHAIDYLDVPPDAVVQTMLVVDCERTRERILDVEQFWNKGTCRTLFRRATINDREVHSLRIVEIAAADGTHFLRFGSDSTLPSGLLSHDLVTPTEEVVGLFP